MNRPFFSAVSIITYNNSDVEGAFFIVIIGFHLTAEHRRHHVDLCREKRNWDMEWKNIVFSGEFQLFQFCLGMHD